MWLLIAAVIAAILTVLVIVIMMRPPDSGSVTPPTGSAQPSQVPQGPIASPGPAPAQNPLGPAGFTSPGPAPLAQPSQGPSGFTSPGPSPSVPGQSLVFIPTQTIMPVMSSFGFGPASDTGDGRTHYINNAQTRIDTWGITVRGFTHILLPSGRIMYITGYNIYGGFFIYGYFVNNFGEKITTSIPTETITYIKLGNFVPSISNPAPSPSPSPSPLPPRIVGQVFTALQTIQGQFTVITQPDIIGDGTTIRIYKPHGVTTAVAVSNWGITVTGYTHLKDSSGNILFITGIGTYNIYGYFVNSIEDPTSSPVSSSPSVTSIILGTLSIPPNTSPASAPAGQPTITSQAPAPAGPPTELDILQRTFKLDSPGSGTDNPYYISSIDGANIDTYMCPTSQGCTISSTTDFKRLFPYTHISAITVENSRYGYTLDILFKIMTVGTQRFSGHIIDPETDSRDDGWLEYHFGSPGAFTFSEIKFITRA